MNIKFEKGAHEAARVHDLRVKRRLSHSLCRLMKFDRSRFISRLQYHNQLTLVQCRRNSPDSTDAARNTLRCTPLLSARQLVDQSRSETDHRKRGSSCRLRAA